MNTEQYVAVEKSQIDDKITESVTPHLCQVDSQTENMLGSPDFVLSPQDLRDFREVIQSLVNISNTHVETGSPSHLQQTHRVILPVS